MMNMMANPAMMHPLVQQQMFAQQQAAAAYAYQQQMMLQQQQQRAAEAAGAGAGKAGEKGAGKAGKGKKKGDEKGKGKAPEVDGAGEVPMTPPRPTGPAEESSPPEEAVRDYAPAKPRLLQIVDPISGKPIDTIGMNFAPRKPSSPLQIINPESGQAIGPSQS